MPSLPRMNNSHSCAASLRQITMQFVYVMRKMTRAPLLTS
jgi:hypothetical protein